MPFETFSRQRENAQSICTHDHVLSIDSDEVMSEALVQAISELKVAGFDKDAYRIRREWFVLGQPVRAFYPIVSPDYPVRLVDRRVVHFGASNGVHECPAGYVSEELIDAPLSHFTFNSEREFSEKLDFYTSIAANDLLASGKPLRTKPLAAIHALGAFEKWYFMKGSWRDGSIGLRAGRFAASYTWHKYRKAALVRQRP